MEQPMAKIIWYHPEKFVYNWLHTSMKLILMYYKAESYTDKARFSQGFHQLASLEHRNRYILATGKLPSFDMVI